MAANTYSATVTIDTGKAEGSKGKPYVKLSLNGLADDVDDAGQPVQVVVSTRNFALTGMPGIGDGTLPDAGAVRAMGQALVRFADRIDAGKVGAVKATGPVPVTSKNGAVQTPAAPPATLPTV